MFTGSLFTIGKTWMQLKCPLTGEWIKMWQIVCIEILTALALKKNEIMSFRNMNGPMYV